MSKSKVHMPKELKKKCQVAIHSATAAAAAAGAIPIPMSDAIPITAAQIGMVVALGIIQIHHYGNQSPRCIQLEK